MPNDFASLEQLQNRLLLFQNHDSAVAQPFQWKFTCRDLSTLLARLDDRQRKIPRIRHRNYGPEDLVARAFEMR
jgi:hypothetical protein